MAGFLDFVESTSLLLLSFRGARKGGLDQSRQKAGFTVGTIAEEAGEVFALSDLEASTHLYVIGSSGSGKSTFLLRLFTWEVERCR